MRACDLRMRRLLGPEPALPDAAEPDGDVPERRHASAVRPIGALGAGGAVQRLAPRLSRAVANAPEVLGTDAGVAGLAEALDLDTDRELSIAHLAEVAVEGRGATGPGDARAGLPVTAVHGEAVSVEEAPFATGAELRVAPRPRRALGRTRTRRLRAPPVRVAVGA